MCVISGDDLVVVAFDSFFLERTLRYSNLSTENEHNTAQLICIRNIETSIRTFVKRFHSMETRARKSMYLYEGERVRDKVLMELLSFAKSLFIVERIWLFFFTSGMGLFFVALGASSRNIFSK